jgi:hypothetical protein
VKEKKRFLMHPITNISLFDAHDSTSHYVGKSDFFQRKRIILIDIPAISIVVAAMEMSQSVVAARAITLIAQALARVCSPWSHFSVHCFLLSRFSLACCFISRHFCATRFEPSFHLHHARSFSRRRRGSSDGIVSFLFSTTAAAAKLLCHCAIHRDNQTKTKKQNARTGNQNKEGSERRVRIFHQRTDIAN